MKDIIKGKFFTILTVAITIVLAGVAVFTAFRLYQLRQESVSPASPESEPAAWDCKNYTFSVSSTGVVSVNNSSFRNEPPQQAKVYIDNQLRNTFDVPALPKGQSATLGTVDVPNGQSFSWKVIGTLDCQNSGTITTAPISCKELKFTISIPTLTPTPTEEITPTLTLTPTLTPTTTLTPTPTDKPVGGNDPTPTLTPVPTSTTAPTIQASPTPTGLALPDAGISTPTLFGLSLGFLLILAALLLAI